MNDVTTWDTYISSQFSKRDNIDPDEAIIGTVISISPLSISILDDEAILTEGTNCRVGESLKSITGQISINGVSNEFIITRTLSINDDVLCVPIDAGQRYVIVDKV